MPSITSVPGAEAIAAFWGDHILTNGVQELLVEAGNYGKSMPMAA